MHGTAWNRQAGILQEQENTVIMHLYFMYTDILFFLLWNFLGVGHIQYQITAKSVQLSQKSKPIMVFFSQYVK